MYGSSKSGSNIKFINRDSQEGKEIHNVLVKNRIADEDYPFKPGNVVAAVKIKLPWFTQHSHQLAWKRHKVRPQHNSRRPDQTNRNYCIYHAAHGDYTYSQQWIDKLVKVYGDDQEMNKLRAGKKLG